MVKTEGSRSLSRVLKAEDRLAYRGPPMAATTPASQEPPRQQPAAADDSFTSGARWALMIAGVLLAVIGLVLWIFPVKHTKPAPESATCTDSKSCWVEVEDAPELLLSSFVVLGVLLLLIGVNNRKIIKFAGPAGIGMETSAAKAADEAKEKTEEKAREAGLSEPAVGAATLLAGAEAEARAHELEKIAGRALGAVEVEKVARDAALVAVEKVREEPSIE